MHFGVPGEVSLLLLEALRPLRLINVTFSTKKWGGARAPPAPPTPTAQAGWTSIPFRKGRNTPKVASCYRHRDKPRPDGPQGLNTVFHLTLPKTKPV